MRRMSSTWRSGPLAVPSFRLLVTGQFASTIGDYCYAVALPWLVLANHGSPALLGVVLACYGVPRTVLIPIGGVLADKIGPRTLMLGADLSRCVLVAILAALAAKHSASLVALGPTAALIGAGEGLFIPASVSIMPSLLDEEQLGAGNALSSAAVQAGSLLGPALGGVLVAVTGASTWAFAIDAASFAVSALTLALIPARPPAREPEGAAVPGLRSDEGATREGTASKRPQASEPEKQSAAQLLRWRPLQVILIVVVAANLAGGGMGEVALPSLAHAKFGAGGYGALLACLAAGALLGTLAATRSGSLRSPAISAGALFLVEGVAIALIPYLGGEAGAAGALLVMGATNGMGNVIALTMVQRSIPPAVIGRVMGVLMLCAFGSFPLSVAVTGLLVHHFGTTPFFPVAGGLLVAAILFGLSQREFRTFGTATAEDAAIKDTQPA
jgi:Major Facilitator Superfamily